MEDEKDKPLKFYSVNWSVEILASSPQEAAEEALESIINGTAPVFEVMDQRTKDITLIDLEDK